MQATQGKPKTSKLPLLLIAIVVVVGFLLAQYRPDRPIPLIPPGSSSGPSYGVQIIRPRMGLPLGGVLPPQLFGLESFLGFDASSPGAVVGAVNPGRVELRSDDWELVLVVDELGQLAPGTQVSFELVFEERRRRVRCWPANPEQGTLSTSVLGEPAELSGSFHIELTHCVDAETGKPIGWPPKPLVLHGSFDRLPYDTDAGLEGR